jgi:hypothetical protein
LFLITKSNNERGDFLPGKIKNMIDTIVAQRSGGSEIIAGTVIVKLCLKGIIVKKYDKNSEDDPVVIDKLQKIAKELDVKL